MKSAFQVINFSTRDFKASIDIKYLVKVVALPHLTLSPDGPNYVVGLMNVAGVIIPVMDLSMRLMMSIPQKYELNTPVLICKTTAGQMFGVIVDKVNDITTVTNDMVQREIDATPYKGNHDLIEAAIKFEETISLMINVDRLHAEQSLTLTMEEVNE